MSDSKVLLPTKEINSQILPKRVSANIYFVFSNGEYYKYNTCFLPETDYWNNFINSKLTKKTDNDEYLYNIPDDWTKEAIKWILQYYLDKSDVKNCSTNINCDNFDVIYKIAHEIQDEEIINEVMKYFEYSSEYSGDRRQYGFYSTFINEVFNVGGLVRVRFGSHNSTYFHAFVGTYEKNNKMIRFYNEWSQFWPNHNAMLLSKLKINDKQQNAVDRLYSLVEIYDELSSLSITIEFIDLVYICSMKKRHLPSNYTDEMRLSFFRQFIRDYMDYRK